MRPPSDFYLVIGVVKVTLLLVDQTRQEFVIQRVREWKNKQRSFIRVIEEKLLPNVEGMAVAKKTALEINEAIEKAENKVDSLYIDDEVFSYMKRNSSKQLIKALSAELELQYLIKLGGNSAHKLGEKCAEFVNNYTIKSYGEEMYTRQLSFDQAMESFMNAEAKSGTFNSKQMVPPRIRNRISAGLQHMLVLMPNGKLYSTGLLKDGNLGRTKSLEPRLSIDTPVEKLEGHQILQFESNMYSNLVLTNHGVFSFGSNEQSQLGNGATKPVLVPQLIKSTTWNVTRIVQIAMGYHSSYAIDMDGKLWAWGSNKDGELGDRTMDEKNRPFSVYRYGVLLGKKVIRVCGGKSHTLVLTFDGKLYSMGNNTFGQLGTNNYVLADEPVSVVMKSFSLHEEVIEIQCGHSHNLVLTSEGNVFTWGNNQYGQLGLQSYENSPVPIRVQGLSMCNVTRIHTRAFVNFVFCSDNSFFVWGRNDANQTGSGSNESILTNPVRIKYTQQQIVDVTSHERYSFLFLADGTIHATGDCRNVQYFFSHDCIDTNPVHWKGPLEPNRYSFSLNGKFMKVRSQEGTNIPWYRRKSPYFEIGELEYVLRPEKTIPTIPNNGFSMFFRNKSDVTWNPIEYKVETNEGSPVSIYNTHFFKHDEYMYMFGGIINDDVSSSIYRCPVYSLYDEWHLHSVSLPFPIASGMMKKIGDYLYIFGGISSIYSVNSEQDEETTFNPKVLDTILRAPISDINKFEVVKGKVIPSPLHSAYIEIVDDFVYLFGGSNDLFSSSLNIYRAPITDPTTWQMTFGILPFYTINLGFFLSTNESLYIIGGGNSSHASSGPLIAVASIDDPITSWEAVRYVSNEEMWCKLNKFLCLYCFGVEASHPNVCSGGGLCIDYDECACSNGRVGTNCEIVTLVAYNNVRRWSDGSMESSCELYKNPSNNSRSYEGYSGSGLYMILPDPRFPPFVIFCDMSGPISSLPYAHHHHVVIHSDWEVPPRSEKRLILYPSLNTSMSIENRDHKVGTSVFSVELPDSIQNQFYFNRVLDKATSNIPRHYLCTTPVVGWPLICSFAGVCVGEQCSCGIGRYGTRCEKVGLVLINGARLYADFTYAKSCRYYRYPSNTVSGIYNGNSTRTYSGHVGNGWYYIQPNSAKKPFIVYCEMDADGGGWTRIEYTKDFPVDHHFNNLGDAWRWLPSDFSLRIPSSDILDIQSVSTTGKQRYYGIGHHVIHHLYSHDGSYGNAFGFRFLDESESTRGVQNCGGICTVPQDDTRLNDHVDRVTIFDITSNKVPVINVQSRDSGNAGEKFGSPLTQHPAYLK